MVYFIIASSLLYMAAFYFYRQWEYNKAQYQESKLSVDKSHKIKELESEVKKLESLPSAFVSLKEDMIEISDAQLLNIKDLTHNVKVLSETVSELKKMKSFETGFIDFYIDPSEIKNRSQKKNSQILNNVQDGRIYHNISEKPYKNKTKNLSNNAEDKIVNKPLTIVKKGGFYNELDRASSS